MMLVFALGWMVTEKNRHSLAVHVDLSPHDRVPPRYVFLRSGTTTRIESEREPASALRPRPTAIGSKQAESAAAASGRQQP